MLNELYFLKIIAKALTKTDMETALIAAFKEIETLGNIPEYTQGYKQYLWFMEEIHNILNQSADLLDNKMQIHDTALQVAAGLIDQHDQDIKAALALIKSRSDWLKVFRKITNTIVSTETKPLELKICIEKNNETIYSFPVRPGPIMETVSDITPALYSVKLNTGRILLTTELTESDLIWGAAFPEKDLELAAATDDEESKPTRQFSLLNDYLQIQVFAQMKSGYIKIIKDSTT